MKEDPPYVFFLLFFFFSFFYMRFITLLILEGFPCHISSRRLVWPAGSQAGGKETHCRPVFGQRGLSWIRGECLGEAVW